SSKEPRSSSISSERSLSPKTCAPHRVQNAWRYPDLVWKVPSAACGSGPCPGPVRRTAERSKMAKAETGAAWRFRQSRQWHSPTRRGSPEAWSSISPQAQLARCTGSARGPAISMPSLLLALAPDNRGRLVALLVVAAVLFTGLGNPTGGTHPDEGLYLQAAREMHDRGDLLTPTVDGRPEFTQPPPLHQAATALLGDGSELCLLRGTPLGCPAPGRPRCAGARLGDWPARAPHGRTRGGAGGHPGPRHLPRAAPLRAGGPHGRAAGAGPRRRPLGLLAGRGGRLDAAPPRLPRAPAPRPPPPR